MLTNLRAEIDGIDDQIIELLAKRVDIVKKVGEFKKETSASQSFIRAGREASMLRNLIKKAEGIFPPQAIATMWRMVISTSLSIEQDISVYAYSGKNDKNCFWLAREYFGSFLKMHEETDAQSLIDAVVRNPSAVGVLPLVDNSQRPWWVRPHGESNNIYVFARIPFIEDGSAVSPALAIANTSPEPTDDDVSLFSITTELDKASLEKKFAHYGLHLNILSTSGDKNFLIEVNRFVPVGDEVLRKLREDLGAGSIIRLMGSYAVPIKI